MLSSPGTADLETFFGIMLSDLSVASEFHADEVSFFVAWQHYENTPAKNNPLADEQDRLNTAGAVRGIPGAPNVWNYPSPETGAANTAAELEAIAPTLVTYLRVDDMVHAQTDPKVWAEIRTWGTTGFADALQNEAQNSVIGTGPGQVPASDGPILTVPDIAAGVRAGLLGILPAVGGAILAALSHIGDGFQGLLSGATKDAGAFLKAQAVALAVAGIVLYVLLNG